MLSTKKNINKKGSKSKPSKPFFSSTGRSKLASKSQPVAPKKNAQQEQKKQEGTQKQTKGEVKKKESPFEKFKKLIKGNSAKETSKTTQNNPVKQAEPTPEKETTAPNPKKEMKPSLEKETSSPEAKKEETQNTIIKEKATEAKQKEPLPTEKINEKEPEEKKEEKLAPLPKKSLGGGSKKEEKPKEKKSSEEATGEKKPTESKDKKKQEKDKPKKEAPKAGDAAAVAVEETTPPKPELDGSSSDGLLKSLSSLKPSGFAQGVKQSGGISKKIQQKEKTDLKEDLPEIEQPTGLPIKGSAKTNKEKVELKKEKAPDLAVKGSKEKQKVETKHNQPTGKANVANIPTPKPKPDALSWFMQAMKNATRNLKTKDDSINTSAGDRPDVELKGEANPEQNKENQGKSDTKVKDEQSKADNEITKDFGEEDIYPEMELEMMSPQIELAPPPEGVSTELNDPPATSAQVYSAFDEKAQLQIDEQIQVEVLKHDEEKLKMETDSEKEKKDGKEKLDKETERVKLEQETEQTKAKGDVSKHREDWKKENEKVKTEYAGKSEKKKKEIDGKIDTEVKETDKKVDKKLGDAEKDAEKERKKTEAEAKRKKKEAEAKQKKKSFWDRVADAVSSFFDALKSLVNKLFDGLRSLVKGIIELAKKAVNGLIELARKAVVGLIKAFGEALKAFVSIALAAFPEIAKKINGFIDKAVDVAVSAVNKLAEGLKKFASALLDAIGAALDAILALYQAFYNMLLDALKFIAVGIIKILEGIANLVSAASQSPEHFFGQMSEELLGQDVTKPLPNERPPIPATPAAQVAQAKALGDMSAADAAFLSKDSYSTKDFQVDSVPQNEVLSPEIMQQLSLAGDGVIEFGVNNDKEHSIDALKQDLGGNVPSAAAGTQAAAAAPVAAASQQKADDGLVGPFSGPAERGAHLVKQMWDGIKKWFSENKVKIIAALVLGITGVILANILTGGAIMAALPLLMQVVSVYFAADALFNISKYFGKYLVEAFPGNIVQGATSLARGLAAGAIELVFALLFGGKAAFKAVKAGAKTVAKSGVKGAAKAAKSGAKNAAKNYVKTNVKAAKDLGKVAKDGAKATMKNGKAMLKGVKNGFSKGAKSLDDLGKRLSKKFRFRKFKIEVKNKRWRLLGEINPFVEIANGPLKGEIRKVPKKKIVEKNGKSYIKLRKESFETIDGVQRVKIDYDLVEVSKIKGGRIKKQTDGGYTRKLDDGSEVKVTPKNQYGVDESQLPRFGGGRTGANAKEFAGKRMSMGELPAKTKRDYPNLEKKYPRGVQFSDDGFPDFSPYTLKRAGKKVEVELDDLLSSRGKDFTAANNKIKEIIPGWKQPAGSTWHHVEGSNKLILVPSDIHDAVRHAGGVATK